MTTAAQTLREAILGEIANERIKQEAKWGEQNVPSVYPFNPPITPEKMCQLYELPTEKYAKAACDIAMKNGTQTYAHFTVEELCEAISAPNNERRREELVQLAAVVVQWIECIDRNKSNV